ncbi:hypothetical protein D3H55_13295 [Bacillus salacetis]|uniref:Uncharacterized protein n=1 Tax=Bacillus salacetis TaxID=2315464 RepID=A0A3A1QWE5_9BACI|nr:hypothetical protein [Bacillus salacetis]RIW32552.1 hypothetical protein D3H55_13295 [Bacillus salacetis]
MRVNDIEKSLTNYLDSYIEDLKKVFNNKASELDGNSRYIINIENPHEFSEVDSTYSINILNSIMRIGEVSTEQVLNLSENRNEKDVLEKVSKELGIYDKNNIDLVHQVKFVFRSRLIMMLIFKMKKYLKQEKYNVFLSHSSIDAREVLGIKLLLLYESGLSTYVDWLDDYHLNYQRATQKIINLFLELISKEDKETIEELERFFEQNNFFRELSNVEITDEILHALEISDNFLYIDSKNSRFSKWMPFELGYAEAILRKRIHKIIINYKRKRKGSLRYSSFLTKYETVEDINKVRFKFIL